MTSNPQTHATTTSVGHSESHSKTVGTVLPDAFIAAIDKLTFDQLAPARARIEAREEEYRQDVTRMAEAMGMSCSVNGHGKRRKSRGKRED